ncbi:hypothetical protein OE88DRAFT_1656156 [Heliocybe sulcata]|uniref:Uncharacterized protein n=1 Tax=Heliocybe sulcata TaxID=5364 RepID=A0A5C3N7X8_9AGAM|nr:hypothetical protein OE88DRAFT_1656156 [Heliocybe sulcata]
MDFSDVPSAEGPGVRFDPPDPRDPPFIFRKSHPDPTLQPVRVHRLVKDLRRMYGYTNEQFPKELRAFIELKAPPPRAAVPADGAARTAPEARSASGPVRYMDDDLPVGGHSHTTAIDLTDE